MKSIFLFILLFFTLFFLSFTTHNGKKPIKETVQDEPSYFVEEECIPRYITVNYALYLSFAEISEIRNYYISKYKIHLVPTLTLLSAIPSIDPQPSMQYCVSETWYVCVPYDGSRPGNGGIHREIDEDPDLSPGYFNPNSM